MSVDTDTALELRTPYSAVVWAGLVSPGQYADHSMSLHLTPEFSDFLLKVETFAADVGLEEYNRKIYPIGDWAWKNLDGVHEGDESIRFATKAYAKKEMAVPVWLEDGKEIEPSREIRSGDIASASVRLKAWDWDGRTGLSMFLERVYIKSQELPLTPELLSLDVAPDPYDLNDKF